jgi:hypothetical protein
MLIRRNFLRLTIALGALVAVPAKSQTDPGRSSRRRSEPRSDESQLESDRNRGAPRAPAVGEAAPDFTLKTPDGKQTITRSKFQADRPLVLIFGSFT